MKYLDGGTVRHLFTFGYGRVVVVDAVSGFTPRARIAPHL